MKIDITIEFYHKTATYVSKITGCKTPINIKSVYIDVDRDYAGFVKCAPVKQRCLCLITSDKGNQYELSELEFKPQ